jgi:multidrug efflux system membrane fusion protein
MSAPQRRHWLKWTVIGVIVLLILCLVFVWHSNRSADTKQGGAGARAIPVAAEAARQADLNVRLISIGNVTPLFTVTVRSRVDGELQKIYFSEGSTVDAGAPLADIDPRPFQVLKLQAEAQLAKDNALLENARVDLKRFEKLLTEDSVAEQQVQTQAALVRQYEAAIKVDQAQVESAALQLTYAHITAPVSGRIGLRTVDQGNMVHASDASGIAVITQLHPISVIFSISQDSIQKVLENFKSGTPMVVEAYDRDGHTQLATGKLVTVDNQIDSTTGTVKLRAEFANTDEKLFPNQFVNVQLIVEELRNATVVPSAAVQRGTTGSYVYTVSDQKTASMRQIETGPAELNQITVTKGLSPGEIVVVDGIDKLREGASVEIISRDASPSKSPASGPKRERPGKRPANGANPAAQ